MIFSPFVPEITSFKLKMRNARLSQGLPILLGFAVGVAAVAWLPWQFAAIAVCILFVSALAMYYGAKAKLPPKRPKREAKVEKSKGTATT